LIQLARQKWQLILLTQFVKWLKKWEMKMWYKWWLIMQQYAKVLDGS
jgi:hypothetical protein